MKISSKRLGLTLMVGTLSALPVAAVAQATQGILITYTPNAAVTATSVPTLSEWGMLGLSLLLAAVALYAIRNKTGGKPLAAIILAIGLATGGYNNQKVMSIANAALVNPDCPAALQCYMQAAGGTINAVDPGLVSDIAITNNSGVAQTVTSVTPVDSRWDQIRTPVNTPQCVAALVVPSGTSCYVRVNNGR